MKQFKRILALALAILFALPLFAACKQETAKDDKNDKAGESEKPDDGEKAGDQGGKTAEPDGRESTLDAFMTAVMGNGGDPADFVHPEFVEAVAAGIGESEDGAKEFIRTWLSNLGVSGYTVEDSHEAGPSSPDLMVEIDGAEETIVYDLGVTTDSDVSKMMVVLVKTEGKWWVGNFAATHESSAEAVVHTSEPNS